MDNFGIISVLPPILAILLAFITKNVLFSLFCGIFVGATIGAGFNPIIGFIDSIGKFIIPAMGDSWNASVILMTLFVGVFSILLEKGGGAVAFGKYMEKHVKTKKHAQISSWIGGLLIFFSDSSNSVLLGPIFKPITDRARVSREKLAYICDSTASSMPLLLPITGWGAFVMGLYKDNFPEGTNLISVFMKSVPYNIYTISAILMVGIIAFTGWEFGPMKKAEERAATTGKVFSDNAVLLKKEHEVIIPEGANPTIWDMIIPFIILIISMFSIFLWTGGFPEKGFFEAISNGDTMLGLCVSFFLAAIFATLFSKKSKVLTGKEIASTWVGGFSQMIEAVLILILSWAIGSVTKEIGTASFIVSITEGVINPSIMYVVIFIAACITAFSTGTSWGTFAIFIPLAIASDISVYPAIGAALSGGLFGDHCSPISDSTILASLGASCDHMDHVKTQLPYALSAAAASVVGYIIAALTYNPVLSLSISLLVLIVIIFVLNKFNGGRVKWSQAEK